MTLNTPYVIGLRFIVHFNILPTLVKVLALSANIQHKLFCAQIEAWLFTADCGHDVPLLGSGGKVLSHAGVTVAAWKGVTVGMELYTDVRESTGLVRVKQELFDLGDREGAG